MKKSLLERLHYIERKQAQFPHRDGREERIDNYVFALFRIYAESIKTKE